MTEVEAGFLQGPYHNLDEVKDLLGVPDVVCSRRFAILQGGKPRIIDDLKESGVNKAYTAVDRLALHDIDYVCSFCHFIISILQRSRASGMVDVQLRDGTLLQRSLRPDFNLDESWKGRCVDLSKAYKQIPVGTASRPFCVLIVHHFETGKPVYFVSRSLPFGASASVFGFNRISKSLWHIASHGCNILGGVLFDDYPIVEPATLCSLASQSFEGLLKALGWKYSDDPNKSYPFSETFDVLGARLEVGGLGMMVFSVQNKPGRLDKIDSMLGEAQDHDALTKRQAQVIHGNLNFAQGFVLGSTLKIASRAFAALTMDAVKTRPGQVRELCEWTRDLLGALRAKAFDSEGNPSPVLVFTDAAYENDVATWGIVVIDQVTGLKTALGGEVPASLVAVWHHLGSEQVITLAEAFAALLARHVFRDHLHKRRAIFFIDNEGARHALIKGTSPTLALLQIVQLFHTCAEYDFCWHWLERVPTASNVADLPSRGRVLEALEMIGGSQWTGEVRLKLVTDLCQDFTGIPSILATSPFDLQSSFHSSAHDDFTGE